MNYPCIAKAVHLLISCAHSSDTLYQSRKQLASAHSARLIRLLGLSIGAAIAGISAQASPNVTHTATTAPANGNTNWNAANWPNGVPDSTTAGDLAVYSGNPGGGNSTTYTLNIDVTIGSLKSASGNGSFTLASDGSHALTMDATGLTAANQFFGNAGVAAIVNNPATASASRSLNIGTAATGMTVNMLTDLDIGMASTSGASVNMFGTINNTSGSMKNLNFRDLAGAGVNITSSIGTTGNSIAISNLGTGSGTVTLGVASGILDSNVSSVTQNSSTSNLTLSGANTNTYAGKTTVSAGTLVLNKTAAVTAISSTGASGTGADAATQAANSDVQITAGTLQLNNSNQIVNSAKMGLSGGTFNLNGKQEGSTSGGVGTQGIGSLTLSANSSIDFGTGSTTAVAAFGDSSAQTWAGTLSIFNWNGTAGSTSTNGGGGSEALFFIGDTAANFSTQLGMITFVNPNGLTGSFAAGINSNGEVFAIEPVPEPTTIFGSLVLVCLVGYRERRWVKTLLGVRLASV